MLILRATGEHAIIRCTTATGSWEDPVNRLTVKLREAWLFQVGTGPVIHDIWAQEPVFALGTDSPWPQQLWEPPTNNNFEIRLEASVIAGRCGILTPRTSLVEIIESVVSATRVGVLAGFGFESRIVIRDSRIACDWNGPTRDSITFAEPKNLAEQAPRAFDFGPLYEEDSVALASGRPWSEWPPLVEVIRSTLVAATALIGSHSLVAEASTFEGTNWIAVFGTSLQLLASESTFVSSSAAAIHGLEGQIEVARCRFRAPFGVVLALGTDMKQVQSAWGLHARISGCRFSAFDRWDSVMVGGVLIAAQSGKFSELPDGPNDEPGCIDIADNLFVPSGNSSKASSFAISVAFDRNAEQRWSPSIRIHGNIVEGSFQKGICVRGSRYTITSNELALDTNDLEASEHGAIVVYEGARSLIADNVILVEVDEGFKDARGITIVGPGEKARHEIVVRGNRVAPDTGGKGDLRPLVVDAPGQMPRFRNLVVENNDLTGLRVDLERTTAILVRGNRFNLTNVNIPNCKDGAFQENRVRGLESLGRVDILGATGAWTVDHNELSHLYIWPSTYWLSVVTNGFTTFPMTMFKYVTATAAPKPEVMTDEIRNFLRALSVGPPTLETVMVPEMKEKEKEPNALLSREVALALAEIFDDMVVALALAPGWNEDVYRAHVSDNIVRVALVVGHPSNGGPFDGGPAGTPPASWVQVLGNQVGGGLSVNNYDRMLVVNNIASDLFPALGGVPSATAIHNLNA
ncbi:MAG: right-handed parallel beta-helix repeat-containing protein [Myxococcales bacterium]|nr:right-handed parallel beta-helix repeat-containing protein [Myxococcales bacterium]